MPGSDPPTDGQRGHGYAVLAQLLQQGAAGVDPALAQLFDASVDPGELRSAYVATFDLGVPPYASVFLEADRCVGGQVTATLLDRVHGHVPGLAACHLGTQLAHVARLLSAGQGSEARAFVGDVVLGWLPTLSVVLETQPAPFWPAVVRQALDLCAEHVGPVVPTVLPADVPEPLGVRSGLADIARWLATPAAVGTFISDADLLAIGRAVALPRGFGTRPQRIETLLRSAADRDRVPQAAAGLAALLESRRDALQGLAQTHLSPAAAEPWLARLGRGVALTQTLTEAVRPQERS